MSCTAFAEFIYEWALTSAVEEIVEKTGDLDFAKKNLDTFARAISATGAEGRSIGGIAAEFQKMGIINPKDVQEALDILTVQGKEGAFTLQNLALVLSPLIRLWVVVVCKVFAKWVRHCKWFAREQAIANRPPPPLKRL